MSTAAAKGKFLAVVLTAIAGSAAQAQVTPELGGEEAAREMEAGVEEARQQRGEAAS